jgi:hypothetical protein
MGKSFTMLLFIIVLAASAGGCSEKLESGYDPKRLNMSIAERKALYADPYSQQAQEAQQDQSSGGESQMHKPGTP